MPLNYYLQALGKRVPADVSVVAAEIPSLCEWMTPPWTAVAQDLERLSRSAVEMIRRVGGDDAPRPEEGGEPTVTIRDTLIERRSVKNLRA